MGFRKRSKKNKNKKNPSQQRDPNERGPSYSEIVRENQDFENYYKGQKVCPEEEWEGMLKALRSDLPTGFRITSYPKYEAEALLSLVESVYFKDLMASKDDDTVAKKPFCLPWYPDRLGWQIQLSRNDIRKSEIYSRLHNFLISETEGGNISRQEVVSMIPPILLDVQAHHKVLDMCAAPGSKTAQLIERLHTTSSKEVPDGVVVANDIDNNRCYMLVHQAKRLNSPCTIVTNHDASIMPNFFIENPDETTSVMKFDRVLCDVPCTGDGTMRKNPDIWTKWNAANGNNLHGVQIRILKRGLEMLAIGGRLVYSTCSLNPIEDEAVIHRLLSEAEDSVRLVDVTSMLPGLKFSHGMTHWLPASKDITFYKNFEEVPEKWHSTVRPAMFPPKPEDISKYNLERCIRILPHLQDTGGFFVAVLEKLKPLPWEAQLKITNDATNDTEQESSQAPVIEKRRPSKRIKLGFKEDPFVFFKDNEEVWSSISEFYDIKNDDIVPKCLLTRCEVGKKKNIYLCSPFVRQIIANNQKRIKIINSGVKVFVRCDNRSMGCSFRVAQEGLLNIQSIFGEKRILETNKEDFIKILQHNDPNHPLPTTELDPETQKVFERIGIGSIIIKLIDEKLPIHLVGWKGNCSIRAYITVLDSTHYLRILGQDVSKFETNKFKKPETVEDTKTLESNENAEQNDMERSEEHT